MAEDFLKNFRDDINSAWQAMINKLILKWQDKYSELLPKLQDESLNTKNGDIILDKKARICLFLRKLKVESSPAYIIAQNEIEEILNWYSDYTDPYSKSGIRSIYAMANDIKFTWYEKYNSLINGLNDTIHSGSTYWEIVGLVRSYLNHIKSAQPTAYREAQKFIDELLVKVPF